MGVWYHISQIDKKIIDLLKRDTTWDYMAKFVRAVFPMLIVLRLTDQKDPAMDKLYFYIRRMDKTLEKSKLILDELEEKLQGQSWRFLNSLSEESMYDDDNNDYDATNDSDIQAKIIDSTSEESDIEQCTTSLGQKVINLWNKRRAKLVTDFAIAGWLLSPIPEIFEDSALNMTGEDRNVLERLLQKMMGTGMADDSDEFAAIMNTFWSEYEDFKSKSGPFGKAYIWNAKNSDLVLGKSHLWHKTNSYFHTKVLGKFACRVCSKIVGMGSAERNWGDVKYLKSEKRAHLSPEAVQKQATIFGASCMADAALERQKTQSLTTEPYKFWDEKDFDNQFDLLSVKETPQKPPRILKCYFEDWEKEHIGKDSDVSEAKFLQKYGGLEFRDLDNRRFLRINSTELFFERKKWYIAAIDENGKEEPWALEPECPLYDCLSAYYRDNTEKNVKIVLRKNQATDGVFLVNTEPEQNVTPGKAKAQGPNKRKKSIASTDANRSVSKKTRGSNSDVLRPCGGCGKEVGPVHKCDLCNRNMHPFCGRTIGEEGYGSTVRCKECDSQSSDT